MSTKVTIAIKKCGCVTGAVCSDLLTVNDIIKNWRMLGHEIEEVDVEEARERLTFCKCSQKEQNSKEKLK